LKPSGAAMARCASHTIHPNAIFYESSDGLTISQYIPSETAWDRSGTKVRVTLSQDHQQMAPKRPMQQAWDIAISAICQRNSRLSFVHPHG